MALERFKRLTSKNLNVKKFKNWKYLRYQQKTPLYLKLMSLNFKIGRKKLIQVWKITQKQQNYLLPRRK